VRATFDNNRPVPEPSSTFVLRTAKSAPLSNTERAAVFQLSYRRNTDEMSFKSPDLRLMGLFLTQT